MARPDQPEAQAEADAPASVPFTMAIERGAPPSRIVLGQRPVDRDREARHRVALAARHQTSAPPPNEKNDRKKLELAAKAIDRPNTIWISRRKPPDVSPKASVRPVTMMMITAMILATGPSIDSRIC
jgi:hypothetical protein